MKRNKLFSIGLFTPIAVIACMVPIDLNPQKSENNDFQITNDTLIYSNLKNIYITDSEIELLTNNKLYWLVKNDGDFKSNIQQFLDNKDNEKTSSKKRTNKNNQNNNERLKEIERINSFNDSIIQQIKNRIKIREELKLLLIEMDKI